MKGMRELFVLGGLAFSLALPQLAFCADSDKDAKATSSEKATIDETKSHDRGFGFTPTNPIGGVSLPTTAPVVKKVEVKSSTATVVKSPVVHPKVVSPVVHPSTVAVLKSKTSGVKKTVDHSTATASAGAAKNSSAKTESHTTVPAATQTQDQAMLVKYTAPDGAAVISARLDRSGTAPSYRVGDKMVVNVKANQDCNVVVFNYDSNNTLTQIYPNDYQTNGFVKAGDNVQIGGPDSPFDYQIAGKGGQEKIFVYAYPTSSDYNSAITAMGSRTGKVAMAPIAGTPFRGAEMTVDEYRKLVNNSQVFFSRSVEIKPKAKSATPVASSIPTGASPNKIELTFSVDNK